MATERQQPPERPRDRDVIVTERRSGVGATIAIVVALLLVALVAWMLFANPFGGGED